MEEKLMRTRILVRLVVLLVAVQLGSPFSFAQLSSTSSLSGLVADPTGAVIDGAAVIVKNNATGATFTTKTVSNGTFIVPAINNGTYTVTASAPGFKLLMVTGVKLDAGIPASVRLTLEVGTT